MAGTYWLPLVLLWLAVPGPPFVFGQTWSRQRPGFSNIDHHQLPHQNHHLNHNHHHHHDYENANHNHDHDHNYPDYDGHDHSHNHDMSNEEEFDPQPPFQSQAICSPIQIAIEKIFDRDSCSVGYDLCDANQLQSSACTKKWQRMNATIDSIIGCAADLNQKFIWDMNPQFMHIVSTCSSTLLKEKDVWELIKIADNLRHHPKMNYRLFYRCFLEVVGKHPLLQDIHVTDAIETLPELFLPYSIIQQIQANRHHHDHYSECSIMVDETGGVDNGDENLLFYIREDIGVNSHHSYWHAVHGHKKASNSCIHQSGSGSAPINSTSCHEDRRGELFYYMHRSMLARYATERLSHCMTPLLPYRLKVGGYIDSGYYSHMGLRPTNNSKWTDRPKNHPLPDSILTDGPPNKHQCTIKSLKVSDILKQINLIERAILDGYHVVGRKKVKLTMDVLGDMLEASNKSPNQTVYGSVHNDGHDIISNALSPDDTAGPVGVMGDTATAMRDPIFYRWHTFIDNLFDMYKRTLPPYEITTGDYPLLFAGVNITSVKVKPIRPGRCAAENALYTFWSKNKFSLKSPTDGGTCRSPVTKVCVKNLEHEDFQYNIDFNYRGNACKVGTVRIFLAPKFRQDRVPLSLLEQREFIFVLDIFNTNICPGVNQITRFSNDSSVTTPRFRNRETELNDQVTCELQADKRCGCGWPHHLLLPKGTESGMEFDLIVMITDGMSYRFNYNPDKDSSDSTCKLAPVLCGLTGEAKLYPDEGLPMGYPFDRLPYKTPNQVHYVKTMEKYVESVGNMHVNQITITHRNVMVEDRPWYDYVPTFDPYSTLCQAEAMSPQIIPDPGACPPSY